MPPKQTARIDPPHDRPKHHKRIPMIGKNFSRLTVAEEAGRLEMESKCAAHQELVAEVLCELSKPEYNCRVWKNATGTALSMDGRRVMRFGLPGAADIIGLRGPWGQLVAIEVKTGSGRQNPDQVAFQQMIIDHGGVYLVIRKIEDIKLLEASHGNDQLLESRSG